MLRRQSHGTGRGQLPDPLSKKTDRSFLRKAAAAETGTQQGARRIMNAAENQTEAPEWAEARRDWRKQADEALAGVWEKARDAMPDQLTRADIYAPIHDLAGLAPVFEYHLVGNMARALMDRLRTGPDSLDEQMLLVVKTYLTAIEAVHKRDVRGEPDQEGEALLAKLASVGA